MSEKSEEHLSQLRGWLNGRITISVARSHSQMIHGARIPSPLWEQEPGWDPESVIGMAGYTARPGKTMYEDVDAF